MAITIAEENLGVIRKITATWTSDGDGDATADTDQKINGSLLQAITDPGAAAPTDNYDIVLTDADGYDVLALCQDDLTDRDTANTEQVNFCLLNYDATPIGIAAFPVVSSVLTITVSNAGDTKAGVLILYWRAA